VLSVYCSFGFTPEEFWESTPREAEARIRGAVMRLEREHDGRAWLAWHTAYLPSAKRRPKLKDLMTKRKPRRQTVEEQIAIAKQWTVFLNRQAQAVASQSGPSP
jgi:hypothetical protein